MKIEKKYLNTGVIVLIAVVVVLIKYWDYVANPWTRDGQVRAEVIQITPRVSGPIVQLPIVDNQFVEAGDLLFEIDPRTFQAAVDRARADLDETGDSVLSQEKQIEADEAAVEVSRGNIQQAKSSIAQMDATIEKNRAEYVRQQRLLPQKATSEKSVERAKANLEVSVQEKNAAEAGLLQAQASLAQSEAMLAESRAKLGALGDANPQVRSALAALKQAELDLEFTRVRAPVDGYVTNLNLRLGSQAVTNQPTLALVDVASYWISGFFRENRIENIRPGDKAVITLMSYPDDPLQGHVDSIGWGIAQQDGSTGFELLPTINPTFQWIRLAQRVPVRIHLTEVPEHVQLIVGTTGSVLVMTGTADENREQAAVAAPTVLQ